MRLNIRMCRLLIPIFVLLIIGPECHGFGREIFGRAEELLFRHHIDCFPLATLRYSKQYDDFFQIEKRFTYAYTDSLNRVTRKLICSESTDNPFYPFGRISKPNIVCNPVDDNDADGKTAYTGEVYRWLVYLSALSKTAFCSGYGNTIQGDKPCDVPLNFTQCLAAVDWYDMNRALVDPRLFLYYQSNGGVDGPYLTMLDYFNCMNFVWDIADTIDIDNMDRGQINLLDSLATHRIDSIKAKADSLYRNVRDNMIPVNPIFRLKCPGAEINENGIFFSTYRCGLRFIILDETNVGFEYFTPNDSLDYFYERRPAFEMSNTDR